ncbi:amidase [Oceanobacillus halotolerans]|uniref:amidase n=1 Tax=Oceanobacillus halotolerans TaxID=2663380 RepID=UPI0013DADCDE|nr:amidase [Oceanobacillus halotolerans]
MDLHNYLELDATEMATLVQAREIKPQELLEVSFQQLEKVNPTLNAVIQSRKEKAMMEAEQLQLNGSPFIGVPLLLKNISQSLKGEPLTSGSKLLKKSIANQNSNLVEKLHQAGFTFMGHTNTPEFGLKNITEPTEYGPTRNPWNPQHSPGGSSGGSAAAIAAGIVPLAGASDGGGSIRIPASFTGLVGLKPTRGRTPVGPGVGRQWQGASIDFALTRTVRDSAALLDVLQVIQPEAAFQTPLFPGSYKKEMERVFQKPLTIAYTVNSPVGTPVSKDAKLAVEKIVKWLEKEGHHVVEQENDVDGVQLMKDYYVMNSGEISSVVKNLEQAFGRELTTDDLEMESWLLNEAGKNVSAAEYAGSIASWDKASAQMAAFHKDYDLYITPASAYPAPRVGELTYDLEEQEILRQKMKETGDKEKQQAIIYDMFLPSLTYTPFTQLANLTGQPAISLPLYVTEDGLPLGVQIMAGKGQENRLLQVAYQLEQSDLWIGMQGNPYFEHANTMSHIVRVQKGG